MENTEESPIKPPTCHLFVGFFNHLPSDVRVLDEMTTKGLDMHINLFSNWQISFLMPEDWETRAHCEWNPSYRSDQHKNLLFREQHFLEYVIPELRVHEALSLLWILFLLMFFKRTLLSFPGHCLLAYCFI